MKAHVRILPRQPDIDAPPRSGPRCVAARSAATPKHRTLRPTNHSTYQAALERMCPHGEEGVEAADREHRAVLVPVHLLTLLFVQALHSPTAATRRHPQPQLLWRGPARAVRRTTKSRSGTVHPCSAE
eukprot:scaffold8129_cov363-Prasinococcus_capsulatus_cf.AAC.4